MKTFIQKTTIPVSQQSLYDWHASKVAFSRLLPPWEHIEIQDWKGGIATQNLSPKEQWGDLSTGAKVYLKTKVGPFWQSMCAEHVAHKEPEVFVDRMIKGPFAYWEHTHRFEAITTDTSTLIDEVHYRLPLSFLSHPLVGGFVEKKLQKMFSFRHRRTKQDLKQKNLYPQTSLKIAVTGASGMVGSELCAFLRSIGHKVYRVSRRQNADSDHITLQTPAQWEGLDAVVHLAGEPITGRWSAQKKEKIMRSRSDMTRQVAELLAELKHPPKVLVSASAVGWYGDRGDEELTEDSSMGSGFLPDVCLAWEQAVQPAKDRGIRCVHPRIGVVLSPKGGALKKMLLPFRMGVGGPVGSGKQWMSWIALDDLIYLLYFLIQQPDIEGPINATAPEPVRNGDFGRELGKALFRPAFAPLPAFVVRLLFGEMGQALLLEGARVHPKKIQEHGYQFVYPSLKDCFASML